VLQPAISNLVSKAGSYQTNYWARQYRSFYIRNVASALGYPLVLDGAPMNVRNIKNLQAQLDDLSQSVGIFRETGKAVLGGTANQVERLDRIIHALTFETNNEPRAYNLKISIAAANTGPFRYVRVNGDDANEVDLTGGDGSWNVRLNDDRFSIESQSSDTNSRASSAANGGWTSVASASGGWAPLRFLLANGKPDDSGAYLVTLPTPDHFTNYLLRITIEGANPLPFDLIDWPKKSDFSNL